MKHLLALPAIALALPVAAQEADEPVTPASVVAEAAAEEWLSISPEDLLVMELAPDVRGKTREIVIQLMPQPFSQPWVGNVRMLAEAHWWDGTSVYRVQDNYVTQWGDVTEEKALPEEITSPDASYEIYPPRVYGASDEPPGHTQPFFRRIQHLGLRDTQPSQPGFFEGWPVARDASAAWPLHCYGYIGVARNYAPDTGTGAELYTIIGQPQRHMDRNLAVVGRVIEGMEHLSSLPRGSGELGFYTDEEANLRTPIVSVRLASELSDPPVFEYLDTNSDSFASYVEVRANRNDPFYTVPAGGIDVCSVQVPIRRSGE